MPIANCIVHSGCRSCTGNVTELWAQESGISADEMTVNIVVSDQQFGKRVGVMATLYLPSAWSPDAVSSLQLGLARALAVGFEQPIEQVHIITSIVESGCVVEAGQIQEW